ncbi:uncharacterized protein LOC131673945 [Phymastichus coffea]|uniref:uncharacterized protein LOC131673945 n=1 Tax=Phymastichus coffea TaxID=108790 RepID=UPI00273AC4DC|nr:uncharacterized protein LOC131673945 [Phymastichus coffea]XP_058808326.1 uncharacterized protein LOC131673945 [Phymastichus coffea]
MADKCKECGCICNQCHEPREKHNDMHLHAEIEHLRQRLLERDNHIVTMETQFLNEAEKFPNGELASLKEELLIWQDKYTRLHEAHKRVQKVNQNLEDKLLKIVDKCETEKGAFTKDVATLSHRLAEANYTIHRLTQDNEKYRSDVNLAIQLLQCKPSNFIGQKYEALPSEVQAKVKSYVAQKSRPSETPSTEVRSITVPISTFPPTAMVYNLAKPVIKKQPTSSNSDDDDSKPPVDVVSAAIMAKILEDREKEKIFSRHCNTCTCHRSILKIDSESQTELEQTNIGSNELVSKKQYRESSQPEAREMVLGNSNNEMNVKRVTFHSVNEKAESSKVLNGSTKNNLNLKSTSKQNKNVIKSPQTHANNINNNQLQRSTKNFDDQAKLDIINERLWKSTWKDQSSANAKDEDVKIDVINDRIWRKNKNDNNVNVKPTRMMVIEVRSSDESTNHSEMTNPTETTTSPSFSNDSMLISSSDPSSVSSDQGPRNCLMPVTPGSKNILLDTVGAYETILYTSNCNSSSRPNAALVHHLGKLSRSSVSSSEDDAQLQRVAQWVDTLDSQESQATQQSTDLMTFEGSSDEEHKLMLDIVDQGELTQEIEETYMKLAASLGSSKQRLLNPQDINLMTVEEYRKEQKRQKSKLTV